MLHHVSFGVKDLNRAADFYDATLEPSAYIRLWSAFDDEEETQAVGYGELSGGDKLALKQHPSTAPGLEFHSAFSASSPEAINQFYKAAISHGGKDNCATAQTIMLHTSSFSTATA